MDRAFEAFVEWYGAYGYPVLFLGVLLENAGVPVPGETAVLVAGFLASPAGGERFRLGWVIALATAAAVLGDNVVLPELGHALTARRFGIRTRDIILLPIGGVARLERMPDDPRQELLVALAGPAVNVALAAGIYAVLLALGWGLAPLGDVLRVGAGFLNQMFWVNVSLAVFNLLPAFPMDGGRVLRALLAMRLDYVRATQIAATIGKGMALLFGFVGLFYNPFLVFIALFVWLGAAEEASLVQMRSALGGIPVERAMITDFRTLHPDDPLSRAVEYLLAGFQPDFPVVEGDRLVGLLTRDDLAAGLKRYGPAARAREVMRQEFVTAHPREMLQTAFARLQDGGSRTLPVVEDGRLLGLVTADNLAEVLMIQEALREARRRRHAPRRANGWDRNGPHPRVVEAASPDDVPTPDTAPGGVSRT
jgi:Zn-dependent protease/CBS domain-containing protein